MISFEIDILYASRFFLSVSIYKLFNGLVAVKQLKIVVSQSIKTFVGVRKRICTSLLDIMIYERGNEEKAK